jgi:hypothetical protein
MQDSEKEPSELHDVEDREELRNRYDLLLQEVRVSLPGVQILLAFLLTVPFSQRFGELDSWGRGAYAVALGSSMVSVVSLLTPTLLHRLGVRTARADRLRWSIRMQVLGLLSLALALLAAMWGVARFVFSDALAWCLTILTAILIVLCWGVLPRRLHPR